MEQLNSLHIKLIAIQSQSRMLQSCSCETVHAHANGMGIGSWRGQGAQVPARSNLMWYATTEVYVEVTYQKQERAVAEGTNIDYSKVDRVGLALCALPGSQKCFVCLPFLQHAARRVCGLLRIGGLLVRRQSFQRRGCALQGPRPQKIRRGQKAESRKQQYGQPRKTGEGIGRQAKGKRGVETSNTTLVVLTQR